MYVHTHIHISMDVHGKFLQRINLGLIRKTGMGILLWYVILIFEPVNIS